MIKTYKTYTHSSLLFIVTFILSVWLSIIVVVFEELAVSFKLIVSFPAAKVLLLGI